MTPEEFKEKANNYDMCNLMFWQWYANRFQDYSYESALKFMWEFYNNNIPDYLVSMLEQVTNKLKV